MWRTAWQDTDYRRFKMASDRKHEVALTLTAGADLTIGQIVVSKDGRYIACCSGRMVKVFNTTNGQCAHQLQCHTDIVTGVAFNPANKLQLFSCGLDGLVNQWEIMDGALLRTYTFYMPLYGIVSVNSTCQTVAVIARRPQASRCCVMDLPLKQDNKTATEALLSSGEKITTVAQSRDGDYIAAVQGHELLLRCRKTKTFKTFTTSKNNPFTCVACHPTDSCVATGHANGKITLWWNFFGKDKVLTSSNHWHSLPVQCLAFTPEGSCLMSGGHECVLVRWQMNSDHKDFLPRLGAPLSNIIPSPDGTMFVTSHTDNVLQLITSSFKIVHAIRGLARAHLGADKPKNPVPVGLLCDPRSKALVTNGRPGHLQFYCMNTDTQLYNLDIVGENYVSPDTLDKPTAVTEVEKAAFSMSGDWLVTFERWDDGELAPDYRLKFWQYNRKSQNYQLNTTVETPHYKSVQCLRFRPYPKKQSPTVVSTGADGFFKLWSLVKEKTAGKSVEKWTCDSVGYYRQKPAGIAQFSEDGSILAVTFDSTLTVWEASANILKERMSCNEPIKYMEFGGKACSHFVVTTTASQMLVWDLNTYSVHLSVSLNEAMLMTNGDLMAAITADQTLYVFRPDKWEPVFVKEKALENPVVGAIFLSQPTEELEDDGVLGWQRQSRLYVLDSKQQLYTPEYTSDVMNAQKSSSKSQARLNQILHETPFMQLLNQKHSQDSTQGGSFAARQYQPSTDVFDVMNTPVTSTTPFMKIWQDVNEMLLKRRKCEEAMELEKSEDEEDDEDSMASDSS